MNRREFIQGALGASVYNNEINPSDEMLEAQDRLLRVSLRMLFDLYEMGADQLGIDIDETDFTRRLQEGVIKDIQGKDVWDEDFWEYDLKDLIPERNFEESSGGSV